MSQTTVVDPIAAAIAAAKEGAAAHTATQAQALATAQPVGGVPAVAPPRAMPLKMDDMGGGGISVDSWVGVKEFGLLLGEKKELCSEPVMVTIDLSAIAPNFAVKFGNPAVYLKTYDHVTEVRGGSWAAAIAKAQQVNPDAREYRSVDVPMVSVSDVFLGKSKEPVIKAGEKLGYSTPTTGWAAWEEFFRACSVRGMSSSTVPVELTHEKRTNKSGNTWGIIKFRLLEQGQAAQAA